MEYVGFTPLEKILKLTDKEKVKQYAEEAEARLCGSNVIQKIWKRYFEICSINWRKTI